MSAADDPSLAEVWLPFTKARSDVLAKRFLEVVQDPIALEKLRSEPQGQVEEEVVAEEEVMGLGQASAAEREPTNVKEETVGRKVADLLL